MKDWYFRFVYTINSTVENGHRIFKSFYVTEGYDPLPHSAENRQNHWSLLLADKNDRKHVKEKLAAMRVYETNRSK